MLDKNLIQSTTSWPFVEIRKLLKDRKDIIKNKKKIIFQTGYGPSGLPHIGTFGEVARTTMMINALNHIQKIDNELITFSDDMDALRKIPENIPHGPLTPFAQAMSHYPMCKVEGDAVKAYRNYYHQAKSFAKWEWGREAPTWWKGYQGA